MDYSMNAIRILADDAVVTPPTQEQMSEYMIYAAIVILMFTLILSAILSLVNMEVIPDSLLYAKFQSQRTGGKTD